MFNYAKGIKINNKIIRLKNLSKPVKFFYFLMKAIPSVSDDEKITVNEVEIPNK